MMYTDAGVDGASEGLLAASSTAAVARALCASAEIRVDNLAFTQ